MANLWLKSHPDQATWRPHRIEREELTLAPPLLLAEGGSIPIGPPARLKCFESATGADDWLLIAPPRAVRINGILDQVGLRILQDKDEIQIRGFHRFFFSTERLPQVERFAGAGHAVHCPRCRDVVEPGSEAVCCPGCRTWHHQREERPCWTYSDTCGLCQQPTALSGGYRWQPELEGAS